ncbi:hypothetical protein [Oceanidesulfovibrio marinus]|uniref:Uncharacterized protein n=1 Tax=Oceanidesulfovibrio marinus TaxID=370038 RepID=A0ABX6NHU9_9BACT|nr:hypothetical protein [Oceanidesulfovibrio marinus]QJT10218.1 hypothetical protein E8L03_15330 [Oceanidesulfovibrio marinus]
MKENNDSGVDFSLMALSLTIVVFYAPFTIAALVSGPLGINFGVIVCVSFALMAFGTFLSSILTKSGLVVAPGIGLATFFSYGYAGGKLGNNLPIAALATSVVTLFLSIVICKNGKSIRQNLLDSFKGPLRIGIRASVGTLLASVALGAVIGSKVSLGTRIFSIKWDGDYSVHLYSLLCFMIAVVVIIGSERAVAVWSKSSCRWRGQSIVLLALRSVNIVSPALIFYLAVSNSYSKVSVDLSFNNFWINIDCIRNMLFSHSTFFSGVSYPNGTEADLGSLIYLSMVLVVVVIVDIPGSPYEMFMCSKKLSDKEKYKRIDTAFVTTSVTSMVNAAFLISPSVYYAENNIMTQTGDLSKEPELVEKYVTNPRTARYCFFFFVICAVFFLFVRTDTVYLRDIVKFAIAPNLFCLGLHLTAKSFFSDEVTDEDRQELHTLAPAALAVLLVPTFGFDFAIMSSMLYYSLVKINYKKLKTLKLINFLKIEILLFFMSIIAFVGLFISSTK